MHCKPRIISTTLASMVFAPLSVAVHSESQLEEIVVTAQRKAESLQDAAIAIEAVTGQGLQKSGITNAYELSKAVPALTINNGGGGASALYIRGVGNRTNSAYIDPAVAMSYDGVFMGRASSASGSSFYDLERVEVLKGPQGTLYGRNATGGAINILPAKPVLGETSGFATLEGGNFNNTQVQAGINIALGDNTALRFAGNIKDRDGYNDDGTSDDDTQSFRAQLLTEPSDA